MNVDYYSFYSKNARGQYQIVEICIKTLPKGRFYLREGHKTGAILKVINLM